MNVAEVIRSLHDRGISPAAIPDSHPAAKQDRLALDIGSSMIELHSPPRAGLSKAELAFNQTPENFVWMEDPDADLAELSELPKFEDLVQAMGAEALAWYRSFHWDPPSRWGIYISEAGLFYLAHRLKGDASHGSSDLPAASALQATRAAFEAVFLHGWFHYLADLASALIELVRGEASYERYVRDVYLSPVGAQQPLEEALANAFSASWFVPSDEKDAMRLSDFMNSQPAGYADWKTFTDTKTWTAAVRSLAAEMAGGQFRQGSPPLEMLFEEEGSHVFYEDVPVYLVRSAGSNNLLRTVESIPIRVQVESDSFQRDLERLPEATRRRYKTKTRLRLEDELKGDALEFQPAGRGNAFSVRVDRSHRMVLRPAGDVWELLRIGRTKEVLADDYRLGTGYHAT
jgi:hypothetical protein